MTMVSFVYSTQFICFIMGFTVTARILYSPCLKNDLSIHTLDCGKNATIYIRHHHVERVTSNITRCQGHNIQPCSMTLPLNESIMDYRSHFAETINKCNDKTKCSLPQTYFSSIENDLADKCKKENRSMSLHGIHYECISDSEVIHNCKDESKIHAQLYFRLDWRAGNISCRIIGKILEVDILQTYLVGITLSSNGFVLYEHRNKSLGVYGKVIPLLTNDLVIDVRDANPQSYVLLRVQRENYRSVFRVPSDRRMPINEEGDQNDFKNTPVCCPGNLGTSHVTWILTVVIVVLAFVQVASIAYHKRVLKSKPKLILSNSSDSKTCLKCRSEEKYNHMCDQARPNDNEISSNPGKDEQTYEEQSYLYQNVHDTEAEQIPVINKAKLPLSTINPDTKPEEMDIYIDMLPCA
uniref:Uncharacterized protein LOC111137613 n=1 Tax=Crassostrea virginica TaxID=6565 RepID=A0A8B8EXU7_CRAVI|nr:uncharacterized protein LOC111137613 [Crassostrea virginica]